MKRQDRKRVCLPRGCQVWEPSCEKKESKKEKERDFMRMDHFFTDATISSSSGNNNEQELVPTNRMS